MNCFEQGEVRVEVIQELRRLADQNEDVPELVELLQRRLGLANGHALFPVLIYFRAAFDLTLPEALPLREWITSRDRSEIDSILLPAMRRTRGKWGTGQLQKA